MVSDKTRVPPGVFWADYIKTLKNDPDARLAVAEQFFPVPAAYREAAIALRALIDQGIDGESDVSHLLNKHYRLLAESNFLLATPYIASIDRPGIVVAETFSRQALSDLAMPYQEIGYEFLDTNGEDADWFVEAWGEPANHRRPQEYHAAVWNSAVDAYRQAQTADEERLRKELDDIAQGF